MENKTISKISKQVYRSFPEVSGSSPSVQRSSGAVAKSPNAPATFLLIYSGVAQQPNGRSIQRKVRVLATEGGKILRMSTSK